LQQPYFIFPQRSGEITLPPPVFSSRNLFIKGKPQTLTVKPAINGQKIQPWVIASNMTLKQQWHFPDKPIQVGQTIERTLVIRGEGLTGAQLPRPGIPPIENMHTQQLATETRFEITDDLVHGTRIERFRYIPTQAGEYQFHDITINWWNSRSDIETKTVVRGRKFHINPVPTLQTVPPDDTDGGTGRDDVLSAEPEISTNKISTRVSTELSTWLSSNWGWVLLFLLISLISYIICKYRIYQNLVKYLQLYMSRRVVLSACRKKEPAEIKESLLNWAHLKFNIDKSSTLLSLTKFTHDINTIKVLSELDQVLYSENYQQYSAEQLKQTLQSFMSSSLAESDKKNHILPDMWVSSRS